MLPFAKASTSLMEETHGIFCDEPPKREGRKEWVVWISQMITRPVQSPTARAADPDQGHAPGSGVKTG